MHLNKLINLKSNNIFKRIYINLWILLLWYCFYAAYQKNIKQIDYIYITESFNSKKAKSLLYFDEMNEITKIDKSLSLENPNIIGSFKIKLSNQREQHHKKYVKSGYIEFLYIIGGYIITLNAIFSFLSSIFINPNDNLRFLNH